MRSSGVRILEYELAKQCSIGLQLFPFSIQFSLEVRTPAVQPNLKNTGSETCTLVFTNDIHAILPVKSPVRQMIRLHSLTLDECAIHPILSISELYNITEGITDGAIVTDGYVFESLDKTSLNVTGLSSLNGCINETFTAGHCMKEELLRR